MSSNEDCKNINSRVDLQEGFVWPAFPLSLLKVIGKALNRAQVCVSTVPEALMLCYVTRPDPQFCKCGQWCNYLLKTLTRDTQKQISGTKQLLLAQPLCPKALLHTPVQRPAPPFRDRSEPRVFSGGSCRESVPQSAQKFSQSHARGLFSIHLTANYGNLHNFINGH